MTAIENELIEKISHLDLEQQRKVLDFVRGLEEPQGLSSYSVYDLMRLPVHERNRIVAQALERSGNDNFEILEA